MIASVKLISSSSVNWVQALSPPVDFDPMYRDPYSDLTSILTPRVEFALAIRRAHVKLDPIEVVFSYSQGELRPPGT